LLSANFFDTGGTIMNGTRRVGVRSLGAAIASVVALSLLAPLGSASAGVSAAETCTCSITLHPVAGPRGTSVTITGHGFTANATVTLQFVDAAMTRTDFASATTGPQGGFTKTVVIPNAAALGHGYVVATTGDLKARAGFLVKRSCTTDAVITLSPHFGRRNSSVDVSGSGFCPSTRVRIRFRDAKLNVTLLEQGVTVGNGGNFSATETIPGNAAIGKGYVAVYDASSAQQEKRVFTVRPGR
jgi:hypothetical protein